MDLELFHELFPGKLAVIRQSQFASDDKIDKVLRSVGPRIFRGLCETGLQIEAQALMVADSHDEEGFKRACKAGRTCSKDF